MAYLIDTSCFCREGRVTAAGPQEIETTAVVVVICRVLGCITLRGFTDGAVHHHEAWVSREAPL
jgi:hypothetical protein